ncbi:class I glutamine amidotransferase-like protein [Apodospora peruviana]|uniref:Class I glutamine amidotransferase-like protein n=1 Tax=Apodospora peruviana TaxID=516989 RepID=A0AAE0I416_9PEZI|nr:class I glutamine amidotransferase-like protein [Apodospora peruviana]
MGSSNTAPTPTGSSNKPIRLAILETDVPLPSVDAKYHGYHGVFKSMFERALSPTPLDSVLSLTQHNVLNGDTTSYPPLDSIDAILITGSRHNAFGDDDWITTLVEYTRKCLSCSPPVRVVGVCFGHQIVGRALGALVDRSDKGWEVSVTEMRTSQKGVEIFGKETLKLQQMHRDQVFSLPAGAELLAETDICANQGFLIPGKVITVQGHPEFTSYIMNELLESRKAQGLFTPEIFESGMERNVDDQDGLVVARGFVKFLQEQ